MFRQLFFFFTILLLLPLNLKSQGLQINEVVSKNYNGIESYEAKTEDWIEIFNNSNDTIQLQNYFLSDDENNLQQWQFPSLEIYPDSFIVVFASSENIFTPELHTNFKLSSKGEKLFLSKNSIIDTITIPILKADFSFGRKNEQSNEWSILDISSPQKTNAESNHLSFSHESGFYDDGFYLEVKALKPNHIIRYTLDGSEPSFTSNIFTDSILISDKTNSANKLCNILTSPISEELQFENIAPSTTINKATVIKFKSFYNAKSTSQTVTKDFFINKNNYDIPVISLSLNANILFQKDTGIYVPGNSYNGDSPLWSGNYFSKSEKVKQVHLSYFNSSKKHIQNQNAEIKIHGGASRRNPQKSLRIETSKKYGYQDFKNILGEEGLNKFLLRATYSSWNHRIVSDYLINNTVQNLNFESSNSQAIIVYINGEYWGIHFLAKKLDKNFLKAKFEISKNDQINIIEYRNSETIKGDNSAFLELKTYIDENDLSLPEHYNYVKTKLDIDNFITYHIVQLFFNNQDWPGNNCKIWNYNNSKWRFLFFDLDGTFSNDFTVEKNMFEHIMQADGPKWPNPPNATLFFRKLIQNQSFKTEFIEKYIYLLENNLSYKTLKNNYDVLMSNIPNHYIEHQARWLNLLSFEEWQYQLENNILKFYEERQCYVNFHLEKTFNYNSSYNCFFSQQNNILIYPNPTNTQITIRQNFYKPDNYFLNFEIINLSGSILKKGSLKSILENTIILDDFSEGVYLIKLYTNKDVATHKFIIQ